MNAAALRKFGLRRIAPTVLISTSPYAQVLDALRAADYALSWKPRPGSQWPSHPLTVGHLVAQDDEATHYSLIRLVVDVTNNAHSIDTR